MKPSTDPRVQHIQRHIHGESALGAEDVTPADKLCVLRVCAVPVVLRQEEDQYVLLGEVYVPLNMHGEGIWAAEAGEEKYEDFWIK